MLDARLRFIAEYLRVEDAMTVLCERHGISRDTRHRWKRRYEEAGPAGLVERSRAPQRHGQATGVAICERLISLRRARPHWGARKLLAILSREEPGADWPAASTVTDILRRAGLVEGRRRRRAMPVEQPFQAIEAANDTWCIDFKAWFRTGDGTRCDPLTVTDA